MKKWVKCKDCGYEWESRSQMLWITCPCCQLKTKEEQNTLDPNKSGVEPSSNSEEKNGKRK